MISVDGDDISEMEVDAVDLGLARADAADLVGGDAEANAVIARRVFAGEPGPHRDIVVLNAAAAIVVAGLADDLAGGMAQAGAAIDEGRAAASWGRSPLPDGPEVTSVGHLPTSTG